MLDASNGAALARSLDDAKKRLKETAGGTPTDGVHSADALFRGVATRAMSEAQVSLFVYLFICFLFHRCVVDSIDAVFSCVQYCVTGGAPPSDGGGHGHYGLALALYTHFTSPIRRYADVVAHRQLLAAVGGAGEGGADAIGPESSNTNTHSLAQTATHLNERNRGTFLFTFVLVWAIRLTACFVSHFQPLRGRSSDVPSCTSSNTSRGRPWWNVRWFTRSRTTASRC